jgi:ABC-2 type transport system ATP-binding protein
VKNSDKKILEQRKRIGAVVETPSIYLGLTAEENLKMQYLTLGLPDYSGLKELLELVGLGDTGKKKARNFSLGMKQRLGIAVALCGSPDMLILDEPINGLDPQGIIEMRELILRLNRERNITVLISSHILDELSRLATHYGFIDNGRIVREMSAEELEQASRKCIYIEVTDTQPLALALDKLGLEYKLIDDRNAEIYGKPNISKLVTELAPSGCEILSVNERDESLESFFISLVGGGKT